MGIASLGAPDVSLGFGKIGLAEVVFAKKVIGGKIPCVNPQEISLRPGCFLLFLLYLDLVVQFIEFQQGADGLVVILQLVIGEAQKVVSTYVFWVLFYSRIGELDDTLIVALGKNSLELGEI